MGLGIEFWFGLILIVVLTLTSVAHVVVRHFSRARLSENLDKSGQGELLNEFLKHRAEMIFCTSTIRVSAMLALVLLMAHVLALPSSRETIWHYLRVFVVCVVMNLVFAVALPNAWAQYAGDRFIVRILPALLIIRRLFHPLLVLQHAADGLVRRLAGVPLTDEKEAEADQIEKEILVAVSEGELAGAVHEQDAEMIESVMAFRDKDVADIMTPRTEMTALPSTATLIEAKEFITRVGHSRIPVYVDSLDDIKGVLYAKDLLMLDDRDFMNPLEIMRKVPFVPVTKRISDLLAEMRQKQVHLAIVVDEYGGTAGLVTIEDIVEEIIGDIADEYEAPEPAMMRRVGPRAVEVDARLHIDELNAELETELPEGKDYDTVGGFLFSEMGKIPIAGEELRYQNVCLRVLDAEDRKVNRLHVEVLPDEDDENL